MALFQSRALELLNRLYRIVSTQVGTDQIDLGTPIQLVHDTSREQELAAFESGFPFGGYWLTKDAQVHGGAGTVDSELSVDTLLAVLQQPVSRDPTLWSWLIGVQVQADSAVFTVLRVDVEYPLAVPGSGTANINWLIWNANATAQVGDTPPDLDFLGTLTNATSSTQGTYGAYVQPMPFPLFRGSMLRARATASGAGNVTFIYLLWTGPYGTYPAGYR